MANAESSVGAFFASVVSAFVTAWQDPERLFDADDLAATRKRAIRFALTMFVLSYGIAAAGVCAIGFAVGQPGVLGAVALLLLVSGPLLSLLLLGLESLFVRIFGPQPLPGPRAWDLAVSGVGFAQATMPVLIVPVIGMPLGLLLGARIIVSGMKKLGAASGERAWLSALVALGLPALLSLSMRTMVIETFRLPSASMHPTLLAGDLVLATKFDYGINLPGKPRALAQSLPQLGDMVVFSRSDDEPQQFVKRVVGLPGDVIELHGPSLWRNGTPVETQPSSEPCAFYDIDERQPPPGTLMKCRGQTEILAGVRYNVAWSLVHDAQAQQQTFTVPADQVFVLGDNRDNSHDSRHFGSIPVARVTAKVRRVLWSFSPTRQPRTERTFFPVR